MQQQQLAREKAAWEMMLSMGSRQVGQMRISHTVQSLRKRMKSQPQGSLPVENFSVLHALLVKSTWLTIHRFAVALHT